MTTVSDLLFDFGGLWAWVMLIARTAGVLSVLPGIGTEQVGRGFRFQAALFIATAVVISGVKVELPDSFLAGGCMLASEFMLGWIIGAIPTFVLSGLAVAGQVESQAIGLGMANLIDPSLGGNVSILSMIKTWFATMVFLLLDGHHMMFRAIADVGAGERIGTFYPDYGISELLRLALERAFDIAAAVRAPVLISTVRAQFVLGLLTRAVPQVNIFIVSLPLTVGMGLFIITFSFPGIAELMVVEFARLEAVVARLVR